MKYILVTGGVISGIGKGIVSSSVGALLKCCGLKVTAIKIDPYLNIDAGTFSPYEHGEVYVLDDGGEVDLDLGNYERFLDLTLTRDNNITTGKIYSDVIKKERLGEFMGKTVQVVPHITNEIQNRIDKVSKICVDKSGEVPDVCIIELGGTIGDIESAPFIEAFRQFQFRVGPSNFLNIHVSLVPCPKATGELKSKPTQNSVKELRGLGISPDILVCRSERPISQELRDKLSMFCHVPATQVICAEDSKILYEVPIKLFKQKVHEIILNKLAITNTVHPKAELSKWKKICDKHVRQLQPVKIALVGKYTKLDDAYTSINKALTHAAIEAGFKLELIKISAEDLEGNEEKDVSYLNARKMLMEVDGVLVPGGFDKRGIEGKIAAIKYCREKNVPLLGICLGMQCMVIEYARNVLKLDGANSAEMDPNTEYPVVMEMPEFNPEVKGGTMRLGKRETFFRNYDNQDFENGISKMYLLYGSVKSIHERHRHRFEVNPKYIEEIESNGLKFVGQDSNNERMEIIEMGHHDYFVGTQYHPEYLSRPGRPSPPYIGLILAARKCLHKRLGLTPKQSSQSIGPNGDINGKHMNSRHRYDSTILSDEDDGIHYKDMCHNSHLVSNGHVGNTNGH